MYLTYIFDIDGTLCSQQHDYAKAEPYIWKINIVNKLYEQGHTIKLWTARGTTRGIDYTQLTKNQLKKWGVKYHELIMGKPHYDLYIDDKSINQEQFFKNEQLWR